jgi:hypothetical protein
MAAETSAALGIPICEFQAHPGPKFPGEAPCLALHHLEATIESVDSDRCLTTVGIQPQHEQDRIAGESIPRRR